MSAFAIDFSLSFETLECCVCGAVFAAQAHWIKQRRSKHDTFYCPMGHSQCFRAESVEERLKRELDATKKCLDEERATSARLARSRDAAKGQVTRIKNRVQNGVCPCCNRTFSNLARHMGAQHPDWKGEDVSGAAS